MAFLEPWRCSCRGVIQGPGPSNCHWPWLFVNTMVLFVQKTLLLGNDPSSTLAFLYEWDILDCPKNGHLLRSEQSLGFWTWGQKEQISGYCWQTGRRNWKCCPHLFPLVEKAGLRGENKGLLERYPESSCSLPFVFQNLPTLHSFFSPKSLHILVQIWFASQRQSWDSYTWFLWSQIPCCLHSCSGTLLFTKGSQVAGLTCIPSPQAPPWYKSHIPVRVYYSGCDDWASLTPSTSLSITTMNLFQCAHLIKFNSPLTMPEGSLLCSSRGWGWSLICASLGSGICTWAITFVALKNASLRDDGLWNWRWGKDASSILSSEEWLLGRLSAQSNRALLSDVFFLVLPTILNPFSTMFQKLPAT